MSRTPSAAERRFVDDLLDAWHNASVRVLEALGRDDPRAIADLEEQYGRWLRRWRDLHEEES